MIIAPKPTNEDLRLNALHEYDILDTLPEKDFDDLTRIAAKICETPISFVSLIDDQRQWFKSAYGIELTEAPRNLAFCSHTILNPDSPLIVNDATKDERFYDNPYTIGEPYVVFYAGIPLKNNEGFPLGTLCVIDSKPKELTKEQEASLISLANQVLSQLELRKKINSLKKSNEEITNLNASLSEFSYRLSHDLKSPLSSINALSHWLQEEYGNTIGVQGKKYLKIIDDKAEKMQTLIEDILNYSKSTSIKEEDYENINLKHLLDEVISDCEVPDNFKIKFTNVDINFRQFRVGLYQVLQNLLTNSIKYNDKDQGAFEVKCSNSYDYITVQVSDNGPGIRSEHREKAFVPFERLGHKSRDNGNSTGIGLSTVKSIIEKIGGSIEIQDKSDGTEGVCFIIKLVVQKNMLVA